MRTLITGAGGFVGSALVRRLAKAKAHDDVIIATDLNFDAVERLSGVEYRPGAIDDADHRSALLDKPVDRVFHLATVAGVHQSNFDLGKRVNLDASVALLELLAKQEIKARFVYSSSVGVFGKPFPSIVNDETLPAPPWSYGTHKLICELLITDYARVGRVDGLALRFPGIVARPEGSQTMLSAFLNNIFYAAKEGRSFALPMAPDDGTWLMSLRRCLDNVILASEIESSQLPERRAWTLPALFVTMRELVDALAAVYGQHLLDCIRFEPNEAVQKLFAMVPLDAAGARSLGMIGDKSALDLVQNVIAENAGLSPPEQ